MAPDHADGTMSAAAFLFVIRFLEEIYYGKKLTLDSHLGRLPSFYAPRFQPG
jgi:hypothetical protein